MAWRPLDVDREKAVTFAIEVMYVTAQRVGKIQRAPLPPTSRMPLRKDASETATFKGVQCKARVAWPSLEGFHPERLAEGPPGIWISKT